ncbi:MAG TPA: Do family serine endopeptidase [Leucothrix mucor]|nr:Do family serine endopeptidase [Leucothrix mucor]
MTPTKAQTMTAKISLPKILTALLLILMIVSASISSVQAFELPDLTTLIEKNRNAVVNIKVEGSSKSDFAAELEHLPEEFKKFFKQNPYSKMPQGHGKKKQSSKAYGSGFILSADGYVVTNAHVIKDADSIKVTLSDKRELSAKLIGADEGSDIALLKIEATGLPALELGDSSSLKVGQWVYAIGAPFGLDYTATQGIVSALSRHLPDGNYVPFIQTDVAVNPGNSGGPLFDLNGKVVGVNSMIYSRSGGYMGVSFSIPVNLVKNVTEQLKTKGYVSRGKLGVHIQDLSQELATSFQLKSPEGALVSKVEHDSAAEKAGILSGDVIIGYGDSSIRSASDLPPLVGDTLIGSEVSVKLIRNGEEKSIGVKVGQLENKADKEKNALAKANKGEGLGLLISELNEKQRTTSKFKGDGVYISKVISGSVAETAGFKSGDIIRLFNNQKISTPVELKKAVKDMPKNKPVAVLIIRGTRTRFLAVIKKK